MELQNSRIALKYRNYTTLRKLGIVWIWIVDHLKNYWVPYVLTLGTGIVFFLLIRWNTGLNLNLWRPYQFP